MKLQQDIVKIAIGITIKKLLYPTSIEWQLIQNHKDCDLLHTQEDNLEIPRFITHKCFLKKITQRKPT